MAADVPQVASEASASFAAILRIKAEQAQLTLF